MKFKNILAISSVALLSAGFLANVASAESAEVKPTEYVHIAKVKVDSLIPTKIVLGDERTESILSALDEFTDETPPSTETPGVVKNPMDVSFRLTPIIPKTPDFQEKTGRPMISEFIARLTLNVKEGQSGDACYIGRKSFQKAGLNKDSCVVLANYLRQLNLDPNLDVSVRYEGMTDEIEKKREEIRKYQKIMAMNYDAYIGYLHYEDKEKVEKKFREMAEEYQAASLAQQEAWHKLARLEDTFTLYVDIRWMKNKMNPACYVDELSAIEVLSQRQLEEDAALKEAKEAFEKSAKSAKKAPAQGQNLKSHSE